MARPERKFTEDEIEEIKELGPVLTHDQLAEYFSITAKTLREIFKRDEIGNFIDLDKERSIDVIITRLRKKIEENPKSPKYLQTIRGEGYVLWIE